MIDTWTISLASALVVVMTGSLFIGTTIAIKDSDVGRIWSGGYLAAMLTTLSFLVWSIAPDVWWASAVGNAAFVVAAGLFWAGCRRYNGVAGNIWLVGVVALVVLIAGLLPGPDGGVWAGARAYFVAVALFGVLAGFEAFRGELRTAYGSRIMVVVFWTQAAFFIGRLLTFTLDEKQALPFETYFGSSATALVTMVTAIALASSMSLVRWNLASASSASSASAGSERGTGRKLLARGSFGYTNDGLLTADAFERVVRDWLERAEYHDEQLALLHFDLDDLKEMNTAFGQSQVDTILSRYAATVRRFGPPHSDIGTAGPGRIVLAAPMGSADEALEAASAVQAGLLEESLAQFGGVRPTISIGVALTDFTGFDYKAMSDAALDACSRASRAGGNRSMLSLTTG